MRQLLASTLLVLLLPLSAGARTRALDTLEAVRSACEESAVSGPRTLYTITVARGGFRFLPYDAEAGVLALDTRRNLRAFDGSLEVFPSGRERIGFAASAERAEMLRTLSARATLRVGFFLGFDDSTRSHCVIRAALATSTARIDIGFIELVDADGSVLAREETERFRAFADDAQAVPGEGPRAAIGAAEVLRGGANAANVARTIERSRDALSRAAGQCYADAVTRGAPSEASVVVRLMVDSATGAITQSRAEVSTLNDDVAAQCIAEQFRGVPRAAGAPGTGVVVRVAVRLTAD